ncbi:MAG: hypothetical protein GX483_08340 [Actinomycetaceae bacterium]|nr:hypothetical protein [Actinomycetaceae bacterium]
MERFEQPLMKINLAFALIMAALGWYGLYVMKFDGSVLTAVVIGTIAVVVAVVGWYRDSVYMLGGGTLGTALLMPTTLGMIPMILGFILFMLLISLRFFISFFDEEH